MYVRLKLRLRHCCVLVKNEEFIPALYFPLDTGKVNHSELSCLMKKMLKITKFVGCEN